MYIVKDESDGDDGLAGRSLKAQRVKAKRGLTEPIALNINGLDGLNGHSTTFNST
jgi:hypothetical protein